MQYTGRSIAKRNGQCIKYADFFFKGVDLFTKTNI